MVVAQPVMLLVAISTCPANSRDVIGRVVLIGGQRGMLCRCNQITISQQTKAIAGCGNTLRGAVSCKRLVVGTVSAFDDIYNTLRDTLNGTGVVDAGTSQ